MSHLYQEPVHGLCTPLLKQHPCSVGCLYVLSAGCNTDGLTDCTDPFQALLGSFLSRCVFIHGKQAPSAPLW